MRRIEEQLTFSPSDLVTFMSSTFDSWMDRYNFEFPNEVHPDPTPEGDLLIQRLGQVHETSFLEKLKADGKDVCEIPETYDRSAEIETLRAMRQGREIIYQGTTSSGNWSGRSDFLVRIPGSSDFGDYCYEPWDTKLARAAKPYFLIQLCCYAELLESVQGCLPRSVKLILGDLSVQEFRTIDFIFYYQALKQSFLDFQHSFDRAVHPDCLLTGPFSRWKSYSNRLLEQKDDLSLIANITSLQIQRLEKAGIRSMRQLATAPPCPPPRMSTDVFQTLQGQAQLQVESNATSKTVFQLLPAQEGRGFSLLPPASEADVFFDMEGYPHIDDGLEYLFGVVFEEPFTAGEQRELTCQRDLIYKDWWAHGRLEEKHAFEEFIDWIYGRWLHDPTMHVYHYAAYEVSAVRRLAGMHATRMTEVDELLRNEVFVDLYRILRQALLAGVPSYSIKQIEQLYKDKRVGNVATAIDSVVFYEKWLAVRDGQTWRESQLLKEIRDYNEEDCRSTFQLARWLRKRQSEQGVLFTGKIAKTPAAPNPNEAAQLAAQLRATADQTTDKENRRVLELFAGLLGFHEREDKPMWWRMYDRQKASRDELYADMDCIANLVRTDRPPTTVRKSKIYEYKFDSEQETKIQAGDKCWLVHDLSDATVHTLERETGLVGLLRGVAKPEPASEISIMRNEFVNNAPIAQAIARIVRHSLLPGNLSNALQDLIYRRQPRLFDRQEGTAICKSADLADVIESISRMRNTCLCIQGPPGCGKTFTASYTIAELIKKGYRVGITSNSHKAIEHLLEQSAKACRAEGVCFRGVKVGGDKLQPGHGYRQFEIEYQPGSSSFFRKDAAQYNLLAGTAWLFSHEQAVGLLDYLFVDEAGQVSLANVVGMSESASNIVLLGDQMQLDQPVQGSHPGESGASCLKYLLQERATIPDDMGIFLGSSKRMHPALCETISAAVYDNRLLAASDNVKQVLIPTPEIEHRFPKRAGIVWIPVAHFGNSQSSEDEILSIKALISDLILCDVALRDESRRRLRLEDILIVCPYNLQARKIADSIPGARAASVDKFQGQEAPIVILSMCASDGNVSARGLEFLFNKSRLNVAISRAQTLAFVIGSPMLAQTVCSSIEGMQLVNFFCHIVHAGSITQECQMSIPVVLSPLAGACQAQLR